MYSFSLSNWQKTVKPKSEYLYNCSEFDRLCDGWVPFTIGMGYKFMNISNLELSQIGNHEQLVLCAISPWTDKARRPSGQNRESILHKLQQNRIYNCTLNEHDYFYSLPKYKFVISPEGNGIDCHRHYEALMAGCIPVLEEHDGIKEKYKGCPILFTKDYSEITPEYLEQKYTEMIEQVYDFSKLYFSTYPPEVQAEIKNNGNYWGNRLLHKSWY
jgi:hypothetical protein